MAIMWGKDERTAEEPRPATVPAPVPPVSRGESKSMASIGKSLLLKAQITGDEDLYVDGQVDGSIELKNHNLTVGINGRVSANIIARNVFIEGNLTGNVVATEKVEIRKTGSLQGDLTTGGVTIEDGAYFKGSIDIARK